MLSNIELSSDQKKRHTETLASVKCRIYNLKVMANYDRRKKTTQIVGVSLSLTESKAFIVVWVTQQ